jgi:ABC-type multidrug transport system fused ATPase/permease subunit
MSLVRFMVGAVPVSLVFALGAGANYARVYLFLKTGIEIIRDLRVKLFTALLRQDIAFFDKSRSAELATRLAAGLDTCGLHVQSTSFFFIESIPFFPYTDRILDILQLNCLSFITSLLQSLGCPPPLPLSMCIVSKIRILWGRLSQTT